MIDINKLITKRVNGSVVALEVCRFAAGIGVVGKVGSRKYISWKFNKMSFNFLEIKSELQEHHFTIDLQNGDVNVYRTYDDNDTVLLPTDNQYLIFEIYKKYDIKIELSKEQIQYFK